MKRVFRSDWAGWQTACSLLVAKKARAGKDIVGIVAEPEADQGIVDLVEMLQRSLSGDGTGVRRRASQPARKRTERKKARA
jgi:non-homologous end joining protein Ku